MKSGGQLDRLLLEHIGECMERIHDYTKGEEAAFRASRMVQDAVIRNLQTLAESTQRLSASLKNTEKDIPWRAIAGFRNVLAHDYLHVDLEAVWSVVDRDLPDLAAAIERMARSVHSSE